MANNQKEHAPKVVSKSFMTVGPTLHYSHRNVRRCWLLAVIMFGLSCFCWSRIVSGLFWSFDFQAAISPATWRLDRFIMTGASIFEYPWQILVLGLLMGIIAVVPVLVSQLLSFRYSLIFILEVFFLANLPGFAFCLLVSCFAAACRPLRFRSRFIAIALCTAPQLLYWGFFGGAPGVEPTKWGFSFAPWLCGWLVGLAIAAVVLGIGHFTRYRPGLVWTSTTVVLLIVALVFETKIGFDELDYQFYVAENNLENIIEFHDHSLTEALDKTITDPAARSFLAAFSYPTEPIPLRQELKKVIAIRLSYDEWPTWLIVPDTFRYDDKRQWLSQQYGRFLDLPKPWWMPPVVHAKLVQKRSVRTLICCSKTRCYIFTVTIRTKGLLRSGIDCIVTLLTRRNRWRHVGALPSIGPAWADSRRPTRSWLRPRLWSPKDSNSSMQHRPPVTRSSARSVLRPIRS